MKAERKRIQTSDSFRLGAILALSGGFQDAYTYVLRGRVFSNAQTGNVVLLSQNLMSGRYSQALHYLFPILVFALGIYLAEIIRFRFKDLAGHHWRQTIVLAEVVILALVALIPSSLDPLATSLVSFACAMQVEAFRKLHGNGYATTMCIGNLRSAMENLSIYTRLGSPAHLEKFLYYIGIILVFALGAGLGSIISQNLGLKAILLCCPMLLIAYALMFKEEV